MRAESEGQEHHGGRSQSVFPAVKSPAPPFATTLRACSTHCEQHSSGGWVLCLSIVLLPRGLSQLLAGTFLQDRSLRGCA